MIFIRIFLTTERNNPLKEIIYEIYFRETNLSDSEISERVLDAGNFPKYNNHRTTWKCHSPNDVYKIFHTKTSKIY